MRALAPSAMHHRDASAGVSASITIAPEPLASAVRSRTMARTSGSVALACSTVKNFLAFAFAIDLPSAREGSVIS